MFFRDGLCPQLVKLIILRALKRTDQAGIRAQLYCRTYWNKQINGNITAQTAACPNRQAVFYLENDDEK